MGHAELILQQPASSFQALPAIVAGAAVMTVEGSRGAVPAILGCVARLMLHGHECYCVDGANCFDPYAFSDQARRHGLNADELLDRVFVSRAFTVHQLEAVVAEMLPPLGARCPPPMLAVLGLDHLFLEESLPAGERGQILRRIAGSLRSLPHGTRLLVTYEPPRRAEPWWRPMLELGDMHCRVHTGIDGRVEFKLLREPSHGSDSSNLQHLSDG